MALIVSLCIIVLAIIAYELLPFRPYKTITSYSNSSYYYSCWRPIRARMGKVTLPFGQGEALALVPANPIEAAISCRQKGVF